MGKGWSVNYRLFEDDPGSIGEDPTFIDDFLAYMNSPRGELSAAVSETVFVVREPVDVDAKTVRSSRRTVSGSRFPARRSAFTPSIRIFRWTS